MTVEDLIVDNFEWAQKFPTFTSLGRLMVSRGYGDDLRGAALEGLVQAASRYDETQPTTFRQYAKRRVSGAVHDEIRRWATGGMGGGRAWATKHPPPLVLSGDGALDGADLLLPLPEEELTLDEIKQLIAGLSPVRRGLAHAYYLEEAAIVDLAAGLSVTQSRISQHLSAIRRDLHRLYLDSLAA